MAKKIIIIFAVFVYSCVVCCITIAEERKPAKKVKYVKSRYGVKALMAFAKSRSRMVKEYEQDTKSYKKIKKAIDGDQLRKGEASSGIERQYGQPVITLPGEKDGTVKWIYKPADKTFFEDEKVSLIFDRDGQLVEWQITDR